MGFLTFSLNVTLDGCVDHQEGIADDETHAFFTRLMDEGGAMLWGRVTYEMMESYWPAVARGDEVAPPALREWAVKLEAKPKYVVSSTVDEADLVAGWGETTILRSTEEVAALRQADGGAIFLHGSAELARTLADADLIDRYHLLVFPVLLGAGKRLFSREDRDKRQLRLRESESYSNGVTKLLYDVVY